MNNINEIIRYTLRESISKKVFLIFGIIATIIIGLLFLIPVDSFTHTLKSNGEFNLGENILLFFQIKFLASIGGFTLLALTFANSGIFTSILEKGTIDLFLSKPIKRSELILGRYFGGIVVASIVLIYFIGGAWLVSSIKMSYFNPAFLILIICLIFSYSIMSSIMLLFSIISKSSVPGLILTFFTYFASNILSSREMLYNFIKDSSLRYFGDFFYYIIPKITQINDYVSYFGDTAKANQLMNQTLNVGNDGYFIIFSTSGLFLLVLIVLSINLFNRKDY